MSLTGGTNFYEAWLKAEQDPSVSVPYSVGGEGDVLGSIVWRILPDSIPGGINPKSVDSALQVDFLSPAALEEDQEAEPVDFVVIENCSVAREHEFLEVDEEFAARLALSATKSDRVDDENKRRMLAESRRQVDLASARTAKALRILEDAQTLLGK